MLTGAERRGAIVVVALLLLGTGYDLWRAHTVPRSDPPAALHSASGPIGSPTPEPPTRPGAPPDTGSGALDLNRATIAELERLPGIGPTLARRIVAHRHDHGPFREVEELLAVRGIGPRLLARILPRLAVSAPRLVRGSGDEAPAPGQPPSR